MLLALSALPDDNILQPISISDLPKNDSKCIDSFTSCSITEKSGDTLFSFVKTKDLGLVVYKKIIKGSIYGPSIDLMSIKGKTYLLYKVEGDVKGDVDADPSNAKLFLLKIGKTNYYFFYCGGRGLLQSGSFQNIRFYIVFSKNTPPVTIMSGMEYQYSFCDLNNDKKLDFIQFLSSDNPAYSFMTKCFTLQDGKFIPLNSNFNNRYIKEIQK
jgi:hypothetical protein